jgi:hypothetical protein
MGKKRKAVVLALLSGYASGSGSGGDSGSDGGASSSSSSEHEEEEAPVLGPAGAARSARVRTAACTQTRS